MTTGSMDNPAGFNWSDFWHEPGRQTTFEYGPLLDGWDQNDVADLFDGLVAGLRTGDRVLDVGCGNGAGCAALLKAADRKNCSLYVDAIDLACICPSEELCRRVTFRKSPAEQLEYADNTFRLVFSCYGLEFFDRTAFFHECLRVLQPGGEAACLIYADGSPLVSRMARFVTVYEHGLRQLIERVAKSQSVDERLIQQVREQIDDVPQRYYREYLSDLVEALLTPLPSASARCLPDLDPAANGHTMESLSRMFSLMQVVRHAAMTMHEGRQLVRMSEHLGFVDSCVVPFEHQNWQLGWLWTGSKWTTAGMGER